MNLKPHALRANYACAQEREICISPASNLHRWHLRERFEVRRKGCQGINLVSRCGAEKRPLPRIKHNLPIKPFLFSAADKHK